MGKSFLTNTTTQQKDFLPFKMALKLKKGYRQMGKNKLSSRPNKRLADDSLTATFINHATVLIQMGGVNIITDPVFSKRTSPVSWVQRESENQEFHLKFASN